MWTHLVIPQQFSLEQRAPGPSQDCILVFLQADAPGGISETAVGNVPASVRWHWASHAPSYYSLSRNRAFHLCNSGCFTSCVCIMSIYLSGSQDLGKSMPTLFQQVNGRAHESATALRALALRASENPGSWIAGAHLLAGVAGPELRPCVWS